MEGKVIASEFFIHGGVIRTSLFLKQIDSFSPSFPLPLQDATGLDALNASRILMTGKTHNKLEPKSLPRIVFLLSLKYFCHFYRVLVSKTKLACFLQCRHYAIVLFHFLAYPDQTSVSLDFF